MYERLEKNNAVNFHPNRTWGCFCFENEHTMPMKYCIINGGLLFLCLLFTSGCAPDRSMTPETRLANHIVVDGVDLSNETFQDADVRLAAREDEILSGNRVTLRFHGQETQLTYAQLGVQLDTDTALREAATVSFLDKKRTFDSTSIIDADKLRGALELYAQSNQIDAVDATVVAGDSYDEPYIYTPSQDGVAVDIEVLFGLVATAIEEQKQEVIDVPEANIPATISIASLQQTRTEISNYSTSYKKSPYHAENRVFNMQKAAEAINGTIVHPNEVFDCNQVLGDRNAENGWKEAPGIRNGAYEQEYGGGVCQISSTLFNAVLMADLKIVERHPHSWPMGYIEIGRDATISTGGKNFCFQNSTEQDIVIFVWLNKNEQTVNTAIFGIPLKDGTHISVWSEATGVLEEPESVVMLDESLPAGTEIVAREPRRGKTSRTYKIYCSADGAEISRELAFEDTYRSIEGLIYQSTDLYYSQN